MQKIKDLSYATKTILSKTSYSFKKIAITLCFLTGIKNEENECDFRNLEIAGTVFILGIPFGYLIFGINFSIFLWFSTIFGILMFSNLGHTIFAYEKGCL